MKYFNPNAVKVTPSEAWTHNLPPIGFSVDNSRTGLATDKFPKTDTYLTLSRPPEGSLEFTVKSYRNGHHDKKTLHDEIKSNFENNGNCRLVAEKTTYIDFAGIQRHARVFTTGKGLSRKRWSGILVPSPDGGPYGLLVLFGIYIGSRKSSSITEMMNHPSFKTLIESFELQGSR